MTKTMILAAGTDEDINPLIPEVYDIVWSSICFIVIAIVFWKFVIPRFQTVLDERTEKIEGGLAKAEQAQAQAREALEAYNAQLAEARLEAAKIRDEARGQGQQILTDMRAQAQAESDRIVEAGHSHLVAQRQQILTELRSEIGSTAVDLAEKIIGHEVSESSKNDAAIARFLSEIEADKAADRSAGFAPAAGAGR
jgi:F-type H+-transporting ATPase subunit b